MSAIIRPAQPPEAAQLVRLLAMQMREHALPVAEARLTRAVEQVLARPEIGRFLVAAVEPDLVGVAYIAFFHSMEHAETVPLLEELFVLPEYRSQGLGRSLLRRAIEEFSLVPGKPMELEVDSTHRSVEAFYLRHGFTARARTRWIHFPPSPTPP